jgi:probable rRNA maturation factor
MSIEINIQYASNINNLPKEELIKKWVDSSLNGYIEDAELTIRIVDETEGTQLNEKWRNAQGPTNVLSFPYSELSELNENTQNIQGDIVVCAPVIMREAAEQRKSVDAHWAHMIVHGILHLLGYDHNNENDAKEMESLEATILRKLDFPDPYISQKR